jgi:hypothetical protein
MLQLQLNPVERGWAIQFWSVYTSKILEYYAIPLTQVVFKQMCYFLDMMWRYEIIGIE